MFYFLKISTKVTYVYQLCTVGRGGYTDYVKTMVDGLLMVAGGRDKRGGPILTIQPGDRSDVGPINIGKLMAYYRKIPRYVRMYVCRWPIMLDPPTYATWKDKSITLRVYI